MGRKVIAQGEAEYNLFITNAIKNCTSDYMLIIIESVDCISRDDPNIIKVQKRYTFKTCNHHQRVLRVIQKVYLHSIVELLGDKNCIFSFLHSFFSSRANSTPHQLLHYFLYQSVPDLVQWLFSFILVACIFQ